MTDDPIAEAERAFAEADSAEWLHGRRCKSDDCGKCRGLMDATNAAADALDALLQAERDRVAAV